MKGVVKEKCGLELRPALENMSFLRKKPFKRVDEMLTSKLNDCENADDFYHKASCYYHLHKIEVPTLFLISEDDPVVGMKCVDFEVFQKNPNIIVLV